MVEHLIHVSALMSNSNSPYWLAYVSKLIGFPPRSESTLSRYLDNEVSTLHRRPCFAGSMGSINDKESLLLLTEYENVKKPVGQMNLLEL